MLNQYTAVALLIVILGLHRTEGCIGGWHKYISIDVEPPASAPPPTYNPPAPPAPECLSPPAIKNGVHYPLQPTFRPGEMITYSCMNLTSIGRFFQLEGDATNECQDDGSWRKVGHDLPKCVKVEYPCPANQVYSLCGGTCPKKCGYEYKVGECVGLCVGGCGCPREVPYLTEDGVCVAEQDCPEVDVCQLPAVIGLCEAVIPRWYHDNEKGECVQFNYGGCDGNGNNFETEEQCRNACVQAITTTTPMMTPETTTTTIASTTTSTTSATTTTAETTSTTTAETTTTTQNTPPPPPTTTTEDPVTPDTRPPSTPPLPTTESPSGCGFPPEVANSTLEVGESGTTYSNGDVIVYVCAEGYLLVGDDSLVCSTLGWIPVVGSIPPSCLPADVASDVVIIFDNDKLVDDCATNGETNDANDEGFSGKFPKFNRQLMVATMIANEWRSDSSRWALKYSSAGDCEAADYSDYGLLRSFDQSLEQAITDAEYSCADDVFHWNGIKCSDSYLDMNSSGNRKMIIMFSQNTETVLYTTGIWSIYVTADEAAEVADLFVISTERRQSRDYDSNVNYWNELVCDKLSGESCYFNGAFIGSQWDDVDSLTDEIRKFYQ